MFESDLAVLASIDPDDVKSDVFMPVDFVNKIIRGPDDQLPLFVIHKLFGVAKARAATELDLHENQKTLMLHDQVNLRMFIAIVRT